MERTNKNQTARIEPEMGLQWNIKFRMQ